MRYRFGAFEISEQTRELRRDGRSLPCQPKVFDLLVLLLQQRHRVVPRETILREIWPGVAVASGSVNRLVKETRRTLREDASNGECIRTFRGRGYRFVGQIECARERGEPSEEDVLIEQARRALEASLQNGVDDLQARIRDFVSTCQIAIEAARAEQSGLNGTSIQW